MLDDHPNHARRNSRTSRLARPPVNALNAELLRKLIEAVEGGGESGRAS